MTFYSINLYHEWTLYFIAPKHTSLWLQKYPCVSSTWNKQNQNSYKNSAQVPKWTPSKPVPLKTKRDIASQNFLDEYLLRVKINNLEDTIILNMTRPWANCSLAPFSRSPSGKQRRLQDARMPSESRWYRCTKALIWNWNGVIGSDLCRISTSSYQKCLRQVARRLRR